MDKHHGGIANYRSSEGRTVKIPYRGNVNDTVLDLLGGLRSACTYVGAPSLKQLSKCTTFVRVNRQVNDIFLK
jgi:GMP reductase